MKYDSSCDVDRPIVERVTELAQCAPRSQYCAGMVVTEGTGHAAYGWRDRGRASRGSSRRALGQAVAGGDLLIWRNSIGCIKLWAIGEWPRQEVAAADMKSLA